ncbi:MAG: alpha/beta fold hydrolase, partial [Actinomycetota bacterium]
MDPFASEVYGPLAVDRQYSVPSFDGLPLAVDEVGPTSASVGAIFLHGLGNDATVWHHVLGSLPAGGRYLFYDARGHGRSVPWSDVPTSVPTLAADLSAVIAASRLDSVVLAGHSLGGMTILQYCHDHPEAVGPGEVGPGAVGPGGAVRGLALCNTTYGDVVQSFLIRPLPAAAQRRLRTLGDWLLGEPGRWGRLQSLPPPIVSAVMQWIGFAPGASPTQLAYLGSFEKSYSSPALTRLLGSILALDLRQTLESLSVPVLIVTGARDRLIARRASEFMASQIPGAELIVAEH